MIKYIQQYDLQQYSLAALNQIPETDIVKKEEVKNVLPVVKIDENPTALNMNAVPDAGLDKIISINDTKCIFVKKGTSLLLVANKNNISLSKLMEFNDMTEEGILGKDQYVYLQKKSKTGDRELYIVQYGETIYDVAQKNGIQLKYLLEYNNLNTTAKLITNSRLFLKPGFITTENNTDEKKTRLHLVAPKEGLYAIARAYNVTVKQLKEWNNLATDDLKAGQQIIVSK